MILSAAQATAAPGLRPAATGVASLRCELPLKCAEVTDPRTGARKVVFEGTLPGRAGMSVRAELLRADQAAVVDSGETTLPEDRFLGFGFPLTTLVPAEYRFRVVTVDGRLLGEGSFTATGSAAVDSERDSRPAPQAQGSAGATLKGVSLPGTWRGYNATAGILVLRGDGTYTFQGQEMGRWKVTGDGVDFTGQPFAFVGNHARLHEDGPILALRKDLMELFFKKVD